MKEIGKVTHYYGKIGVAIVELSGPLKIGDRVKIAHGQHEFEQQVESMEIERKGVQSASKGDVIGLKVNEKALEGSVVSLAE